MLSINLSEGEELGLQDSMGKSGIRIDLLTTGILTLYSWHADIKPDNILVVGDKFKLADPGFAVFDDGKKDDDGRPRKVIKGGTSTYGK